jgi:hypothetical protein
MEQMKKGDVIGGLIGAPFEIAGGAMETAFVPLGGGKPQWVKDSEVSRMQAGKPQLSDPRWQQKFAGELKAGSIMLGTFEENLEAFRLTKNDAYLSRAEQLATTEAQRGQMELEALRALGGRAFDTRISIDGSSTTPRYSSQKEKVLFVSGKVAGAKLQPRGSATVSLSKDLKFALRGSYTVTGVFRYVLPRESTVQVMGMQSTRQNDSVSTVSQTFQFGPGSKSATCSLNFGTMHGANAVDTGILGSTGRNRVTGSPYVEFEIKDIQPR